MKEDRLDEMLLYCLGRKLREIRLRSGKSQKEVAVFLKVSLSDLKKCEKGTFNLKLKGKDIFQLSKFLKFSAEDKYFFLSLNPFTVENYYKDLKQKERKESKND